MGDGHAHQTKLAHQTKIEVKLDAKKVDAEAKIEDSSIIVSLDFVISQGQTLKISILPVTK